MVAWAIPAAIAAANVVGGYLQGESAKDAANTQAAAQRYAADQAAAASRFRPVGLSTGFGTSNFTRDAQGNVISAGYTMTPEQQALFSGLQGMTPEMLAQYQQSPYFARGLLSGSQQQMALGNAYLATDPRDIEAKYLADQQRLLAPQNEQTLANLRTNLFNTGRTDLATGGTSVGGMTASNPEMQAYYNAIARQNAELAAGATQAGQQYATFGADMLSKGGQGLTNYYAALSSAASPLDTQQKMLGTIDARSQQAMTLGADLGKANASAGANAGQMLMTGATNAAPYQYAAASYNPLASGLMGVGSAMQNYMQTRPSTGGAWGSGGMSEEQVKSLFGKNYVPTAG